MGERRILVLGSNRLGLSIAALAAGQATAAQQGVAYAAQQAQGDNYES